MQNGTISLKLDTTLWHGENLKISIYVKKKTPARPLANVWIWETMPVNITGGFAIGIKRGAIVMERRVMMDVKKQGIAVNHAQMVPTALSGENCYNQGTFTKIHAISRSTLSAGKPDSGSIK